MFGDAVGAACWRKGYDTCKLQMTPADDKIRIALSAGELLHLTSLAHLGFKKMMPNDRGRGARAQGCLCGRTAGTGHSGTAKPFELSDNRHALIRNWWPLERKRA